MLNGILKNFPSEYHWLVGAESKVWSGSQLPILDTYFSITPNTGTSGGGSPSPNTGNSGGGGGNGKRRKRSASECADINNAGKLTESVCPSPTAPLTGERLVSISKVYQTLKREI